MTSYAVASPAYRFARDWMRPARSALTSYLAGLPTPAPFRYTSPLTVREFANS